MHFYKNALLILLCMATSAYAAEDMVLTGKEAATLVQEALIKAGAGEDIAVAIDAFREQDVISTASAPITGEISGLEMDKQRTTWKAVLYPVAAGRNLAPVNLSGRFQEMVAIPVLKKQMRAGDIITQEDIDFVKESQARIRNNTIMDVQSLIGKTPKRSISQNRLIRQEEIVTPAILSKGARVTMIYTAHNLEIRTTGEALDSGAKGDVIRLKNLTSKTVVNGVIETSDRVRVSSPETTSAEAL